jgi:hypothetical protein
LKLSGYKVKQREEENPDKVDKVPVKSTVFKEKVMNMAYMSRSYPEKIN